MHTEQSKRVRDSLGREPGHDVYARRGTSPEKVGARAAMRDVLTTSIHPATLVVAAGEIAELVLDRPRLDNVELCLQKLAGRIAVSDIQAHQLVAEAQADVAHLLGRPQ